MRILATHSRAVAEIVEAVAYHEEQVEGLGEELRVEFDQAIDRILSNPAVYPPHGRTGYHKCFVPRFRYTIYFRELDEKIWVAVVAHSSRRPDYWRARSPNDPA